MADTKVVTLHDENGNPVAPRTAAAIVSTESGESVQEALNRISQAEVEMLSVLPLLQEVV